jgi:hypothetical protein
MPYLEETTLNIALIHHPVLNKRREVIGSAVTNLDIHDIARTARTYGVANYYIATPYEDQHILVRELLDHWLCGHGASYNPARGEALRIISLFHSLGEIVESLQQQYGGKPLIVATSATVQVAVLDYADVRREMTTKRPVLLLFGTAHGLAPEILQVADGQLPPLAGKGNYNHLAVRSAAAIIIDRLLGS